MPTPFPPRQAAPTSWSGAAKTKPTTHNSEWRCTRCDKLLGRCRDGRMHLRFARGTSISWASRFRRPAGAAAR